MLANQEAWLQRQTAAAFAGYPVVCYNSGRMNAIRPEALRHGHRTAGSRTENRFRDLALARLRKRLLRHLTAESSNPVLLQRLRQAAEEAESLAWLSPFPLLVLPTLLEEKARAARHQAIRQAELRDASREWTSLAE